MHSLKQIIMRPNLRSRAAASNQPLLLAATAAAALLLVLLVGLLGPSAEAHPTQAQSAIVATSASQQHQSSLGSSEPKGIFKRSFAGLGCLGVYDKAKFARLDRVCEECYTLYREPDIHSACRQDCFRNNVFTRCVDALLLSHEAKKFDEMVNELYGK